MEPWPFFTSMIKIRYDQWEFQDPNMEVLYHIRPYFVGIPLHRPYIGLICGRYLQFRFLKWSLIWFTVQKRRVMIPGWWLTYPTPLKNDGVKLGWDYFTFPIWMESHKIPWFQPPPTRLSSIYHPIIGYIFPFIPIDCWLYHRSPCRHRRVNL